MSARMPVLFLAHGDPMNALRDIDSNRCLTELGGELPRPEAVVLLSAHWATRGTRVGAAAQPETIHDFWGFPEELYRERYPVPGAPALAVEIADRITGGRLDPERGLDHGAWTVLKFLYPDADVPVVPVSVDATASPEELVEQGRALAFLRERGILVAASGNLVHNVGAYFTSSSQSPYPWARDFDERFVDAALSGDVAALSGWSGWGEMARLAHPGDDHLRPFFLALGAADGDPASVVHREVVRSMSMTSLRWG